MKKRCFKCGKIKSLECFYSHPQMADGHLNKCKQCAKKDANARYASPDGRKKIVAYEQARNKTAHRRSKKAEYQRRTRAKRPGARKCWQWVTNAIRDGRIIRKPCEVCGNTKSQAHHCDYRKPQDVRWLCFKHHREIEHGQTTSA